MTCCCLDRRHLEPGEVVSVGDGCYLTQVGGEAVEITVAVATDGLSVTCDARDDVSIVLPLQTPEHDAAWVLAQLLVAVGSDVPPLMLDSGPRAELDA